jgi:hypothetical protein
MGGKDAPTVAGPERGRRRWGGAGRGCGDRELEVSGGASGGTREEGVAGNPEHVDGEVGADVLGGGEETLAGPTGGVGAQTGAGQRHEDGGQDEAGGAEGGREEGARIAHEEKSEDGGDAGGHGKEDQRGGGEEEGHGQRPWDRRG